MLNIRRRQRIEPADLAPAALTPELVPVLSCTRCDAPLASKEDLLDDGASATAASSPSSPSSTACWAFELDVLDTEVRCFSATVDDDGRRCDVIRCGSAPPEFLLAVVGGDHDLLQVSLDAQHSRHLAKLT